MYRQKFLLILTIIIFCHCEKSMDTSKTFASSGQGGSMARYTIAGNYLYIVDDSNLKVFDISEGASPVLKNTVQVGFEIETIYPFKDKLFIGSTSVVHIFSIADPEKPMKLSQAISPTVMRRCDPVVAKDTVAYATLRTNAECGGTASILAVYDIKDIANPIQKNAYTLNEPYGLGYMNNVLYVCDKINGLMVFDISNAYDPKYLKSKQDGEYIDVIPYGSLLLCWVKEGMIVYDISDNSNPVFLSKIL